MHYALLVTDLVDSTRLTEELGDAGMAKLWVAHDRIARDLLETHGGREITKTDGFLLLFDEAAAAVAYALDYHAGLAELKVEARAGLHVGPAVLNENSPADVAKGAPLLEVEGIAKPIAARVMSIAHGRQTLLTEEARDALGETNLRSESHGFWRMKGVTEPVEVFEVGREDAPFTPPPDGEKVYRVVRTDDLWLPVREIKHSLPRERDAFVGRERDLRELGERLDGGAALVTMLGIGGTGKTRLVTRYGWSYLGDWPGGVWFCDLSEASDIDGIVSAVARTLDVPLGKEDPVALLGHAIAGRGRCLVVLDNFEQVTGYAESTLGRWLDRARDASFVVTSREVLGLPGETTLALDPLDTEQGIELFSARARQASRDFVLTDEERPLIESLVKLLDGLPLAIELAAARLRMMPPALVLSRMSERFKLIASSGGRPGRHATLRGVLDWSWDLLSGDEQAALAQLSVFEGGFTLEAAEEVLLLDEAWPMDAVQALVDKSLARRVSEERFNLLISVQEYAAEKLEQIGGREETEWRHGEHYSRHGTDEALDALQAHEGAARRKRLGDDLDNLVAACRRATARGEAENALGALRAAWAVVSLRGPVGAAKDLASSFLELSSLNPSSRARGALVLGQALQHMGLSEEAHAQLDLALAGARATGDRRFEGIVLGYMGTLHRNQGRHGEAIEHYEAALAVHREVGNRPFEGVVLGFIGTVHYEQGRYDEAQIEYEAALEAAQKVGDRRYEGITLGNLGVLKHSLGEFDDALAHYDAALAVHREVGNRRSEGLVLGNLGSVHRQQGRQGESLEHYRAALEVAREVGNRRSEGIVLGNLCTLHHQMGRYVEAGKCSEAALVLHRETGNRHAEGVVLGNLGMACEEQGRYQEAGSHFDAAEELFREMGDPMHLGIILCGRARAKVAEGSMEEARSALAEAEAFAARLGTNPDSELGHAITKTRAAFRHRFGPGGWIESPHG